MTDSAVPPVSAVTGRALVLAGGGAAGNAWELGLVAGLAEAGVDVTSADLIVGTSAGSTVAAQITSGTLPADLYASILVEQPASQTGGSRPAASAHNYLHWSNELIAQSSDPTDMRRRLGAAAIQKDESDGAAQARWHDIVASRLPSHEWPQQRVLITAVDAVSGEAVTFDRDSGIGLVDAVAASTSNGFGPFGPYRIGDRRYLNGGYRRSENADLAAGHASVLVFSPFGGRTRMPLEWGMDLATQVAELRAGGSAVETVFPDAAAGEVFDANAMDPATRRQAAIGGFEQGKALARKLRDFWN